MAVNDETPINMPAPAIPILTDVVIRGDKAPEEDANPAMSMALPTMPDGFDDDDLPTGEPDEIVEPEEPSPPGANFSLDEITEQEEASDTTPAIPQNIFNLGADNREDTPQLGTKAISKAVEEAMEQLMPILESVARETLTEILKNKQSEGEDEPEENQDKTNE